jgi:hypothetical protein
MVFDCILNNSHINPFPILLDSQQTILSTVLIVNNLDKRHSFGLGTEKATQPPTVCFCNGAVTS